MDSSSSKKIETSAQHEMAERISKKEDVQAIIHQYKKLIAEGMEYFQRFDTQSELSSILPKLLNFNPVNQFFGADKLTNHDYITLVNVATNVYWDGDFASAKIMFNLLINLFPLNVQAHIFLAEIEGQERGIDAAVYNYEK